MAATALRAIDRTPDAAAPDAVDLSAVLAILRRRWQLILAVLALFLGAGFAYTVFADKIYSATTRVLLDPRDKQIVGTGLTGPAQGSPAGWIETQVDLVTAYSTLRKVVVRENLVEDPEFGGTGTASDIDAVVRSLAEHVRAERSADTYVVEVIVSSLSAETAARLSTAVAEAFVESSTEAKQNAARQANDLLLRQIDDLQAKAREAEDRVQQYRQQNNLVQIDGKPVDEQTLAQLNEASIAAKLKADAASERWRKIEAMTRSGNGDFGPALDTIDSAVLGRLKVEYAISMREQAELAETLGARHPKMAALEAEVARTRTLILQELKSQSSRAQVEADLAKAQAAATAAAVAGATRQVNDNSEASVALRDLEGEATIRRDVYKAFVARAQETGLQENLQVSDVRIISPAQVPLSPSQPRKSIIMALALIGGLGTGVSLALYLGRPGQKGEAPPEPKSAEPTSPDGEAVPLAPELAGGEVLVVVPVPAPLASGADIDGEESAERMIDMAEAAASNLAVLASGLTKPDETDGPAVHVVFGTSAGGAIAAVAFGLSRALAADGAQILLVDASNAAVNLGGALIGPGAPGILDVEIDDADPEAIGSRLDGMSVVLLPAAGAALRHRISGYGDRLVETIEDLADGFERIVIDLGPSCPPGLFSALAGIADDVLMVVDAGEVGRPDIVAMFEELRDLVPELRGMVAVRPVPVVVAASHASRTRS